MIKDWFKLRGKLSPRDSVILSIIGLILILIVWGMLAEFFAQEKAIYDAPNLDLIGLSDTQRDSLAVLDSIARAGATKFEKVYPILPTPLATFSSFDGLFTNDDLLGNLYKSVSLNFRGYLLSILIAFPIAFLIGMLPVFRGLFSKPVDAIRYLPLTALTGLFMTWFGINDFMKITFLAVGIIVYLLPVIVQRIDEVEEIYLKTVFTLGATSWQTIKSVYSPYVFSKVSDDLRVLTAISWTYIIIAELLNQQGGIGAMIYLKGRLGKIDQVFALLIIIILVGFLQDRLFLYLDRVLFPHKYFKNKSALVVRGLEMARYGLLAFLIGLVVMAFIPSAYIGLAYIFLFSGLLFCVYGEFTLRKVSNDG